MLFNFNMDSKDYSLLILVRQPLFNSILNRGYHDALKQRITVNYELNGITPNEIREYIFSCFKLAGISNDVFTDEVIIALSDNSEGSIRVLNNLVDKCFMAAYQENKNIIDEKIVTLAKNELCLDCF